jgi:hypothetical protein
LLILHFLGFDGGGVVEVDTCFDQVVEGVVRIDLGGVLEDFEESIGALGVSPTFAIRTSKQENWSIFMS